MKYGGGKQKLRTKTIRDLAIKNKSCKIEMEVWEVNFEKIWKSWEKINSLKIQSLIFKYIHNAWLTGNIAKRRHMIRNIPKCPLCKKFEFSKKHVIINCQTIKNERDEIISIIKKIWSF